MRVFSINLVWIVWGLLLPLRVAAQMPITWETLEDVKFQHKYDVSRNVWSTTAKFGPKVKAVEGKQIKITGYMIPLDVNGGQYVLSALPYSACFFCGGGGRETVMELWLVKTKRRYSVDDRVTLTGILRTNTEEYGLSYVLENATEATP